MFDLDDPEDDLRYPVFYTDGRRAALTADPRFPSRFVYVAGPLWDRAKTPEEAKVALDMAHVAWNLTRLSEPLRTELLGQVVRDLVARTGDAEDFSDVVMRAMRWPRDQRIVVSVPFEEQKPGEWHVAVLVATPGTGESANAKRPAKTRKPRRG